MKSKLKLTITATTMLVLQASLTETMLLQPAQAQDAAPAAAKKEASGKCAQGKCGTEKLYGKVSVAHDTQDKLIMARDGKCGASGLGAHATVTRPGTCSSGLCGA